MTREELIAYRLNRLAANRNPKAILAFMGALLDDEEATLQTILDEIKVDTARRLEQIADQQAKLEATSTALISVNVHNLPTHLE